LIGQYVLRPFSAVEGILHVARHWKDLFNQKDIRYTHTLYVPETFSEGTALLMGNKTGAKKTKEIPVVETIVKDHAMLDEPEDEIDYSDGELETTTGDQMDVPDPRQPIGENNAVPRYPRPVTHHMVLWVDPC
jgi:hypothetical protein